MTNPDRTGIAFFKLIGCYLLGGAVVAVLFGLGTSPFLIPVAFGIGLIMGLPALVAAIFVLVLFETSIRNRPLIWIIPVPFVATGIFAVGARLGLVYDDTDWSALLSDEMLLYQAAIFVGAGIAAWTFRRWELKLAAPT